MNRFIYALDVLLNGIPEPAIKEVEKEVEKVVEKIIVGKPYALNVYKAEKITTEHVGFYASQYINRTHLGWYLTCEQAHKKHPGCEVKQCLAFRIGKEYFRNEYNIKIGVAKP